MSWSFFGSSDPDRMGEGDGGFESLFMGESRWYSAEFLYTDNQRLPDTAFEVQGGVILQRKPISALSDDESAKLVHYSGCAITPGFVNSHNHSFQSLLKGICDDADFFTWRDDGLYKYARLMTADDLYAGAMFAFAEMLKCGITTVCDFFYINDQANDNAKAIIAAARDLGIRLTMARTLYDWDGAPDRFIESVDVAVANTQALMDDYANDPLVHVVPAPHSLHGASEALIKAGCELSAAYHRPFHMHIAEGQYERQMMLDKHGLTPIQYLDKLGVLTDRLVGIHCVWLDDTDIDRMAGAGTKLSYNPSSNMALGDGVTKIRQMLDAGITISLGTDGGSSNNRASIIEEMRMCNLLQKVVLCDATQSTAEEAFLMGTRHGGTNLGLPLGSLSAQHAADFVVFNLDDLSLQPDPQLHFGKHVVYAVQPEAIDAVYVAGQRIVERGHIVTVPDTVVVDLVKTTMNGMRERL